MIKRFFFVQILIFTSCILATENAEKKAFLLSFPRSGSTWTRYFIEVLTNRPTTTFEQPPHRTNLPLLQKFNPDHSYNGPTVYKAHYDQFLYGALSENEVLDDYLLILILRDYKECLIRHFGTFQKVEHFINNEDSYSCFYLNNIKFFNSWKKENRLLVYYEDLIVYPEREIEKIISFLGMKNHFLLKAFMKDYYLHKSKMVEYYHHNVDPSQTKGRCVSYHKNKLSRPQLELLNDWIKEQPEEIKQHLNRYLD